MVNNMNHDWYKKQKVREKVTVTLPRYGHDGCSFKLIMQKFIYKTLPKKKRRDFEVDFDVVWSNIQMGKEKLNPTKNPKYDTINKTL